MTEEELIEKARQRIKSTLEIPAECIKENKEIDDRERMITMTMIEDVLNYIANWKENSLVLEKYHQRCFEQSFQCGKER